MFVLLQWIVSFKAAKAKLKFAALLERSNRSCPFPSKKATSSKLMRKAR